MFRNIKVKIYPTFKQKEVLDNHFNAYRYCYNLCLEYKMTMWSQWRLSKSGYDMQKELFEIRKETIWLSKCKAECLRDAALNVYKAYKNFYNGSGHPKFKRKNGIQSFTANQSVVSKQGKINFFKNKIKYKTSENNIHLLETNKIKKCTFKKDKCGDYWASCLIEMPDTQHLPKNDNKIGLDLGIKDLVITSDGQVFENKKYLRNAQYKLRRLQRKFSKSKKGGNNREKLRVKVARVYRKTVRQKEHYYHQITNEIIRDNQTIVLETLKIKNMVLNHKLARSISDVSWGLVVYMLENKAKEFGRKIIKIDTFYPSSKTCSSCRNVKETLSLSERVYNCECCGMSMDRDLNAAINIKQEGVRIAGLPVEDTINGLAYEAGSKSIIINKLNTYNFERKQST